jgi:hypothetical protein
MVGSYTSRWFYAIKKTIEVEDFWLAATPHNPTTLLKLHGVGVKRLTTNPTSSPKCLAEAIVQYSQDMKPDPSKIKVPDVSKFGKCKGQLSSVKEIFNTVHAVCRYCLKAWRSIHVKITERFPISEQLHNIEPWCQPRNINHSYTLAMAFHPPANFTSLNHGNLQSEALAVTFSFPILATVAVTLRLYSHWMTRTFGYGTSSLTYSSFKWSTAYKLQMTGSFALRRSVVGCVPKSRKS